MLKDLSPNELAEVFQYKDDDSLSFAIILSALSLDNSTNYFPVQTFRQNPFSELWRKQFHHGSNWKAQYRSELNQGDNRLAHRVFESPGGNGREYRLKRAEILTEYDKANIDAAKNIISALEEGGSVVDSSDETFQTAVRILDPVDPLPAGPIDKPAKRIQSERRGYRGNPRISKRALVETAYRCAYDPGHETFYSPTLGGNYVEMHHIIPLSHQDNFDYSIDVPENIVPLCPNCHRKIHNSDDNSKNEMLKNLYTAERIEGLAKKGVILELRKLQSYYQ